MTMFQDGLQNVVANLGTSRDKSAFSAYVFEPMGYEQLLAAYRGAWLPRAIVNIPAQDATRKWRAWQAEADQIEKIENVEKSLRVRDIVEECKIAARLFGGAVIYINTGDKQPEKPLDPSRVKAIRGLTVLTPQEIKPEEIVRDIASAYYGKAEFYSLTNGANGGDVRIHASRLVVMEGASVPNGYLYGNGWADSVLQSGMDAIRQMDSTSANIASLVFEAKVDVFRFKGFADLLKSAGGDDVAVKRLHTQAAMKGINGAVVIDAEDEYSSKSASFSGLDAIMDRFANHVSGAYGIPVTRLFGRSAVGLSGSGDGDERVYFDRVNHIQTTELEPAMRILDECIIWAALGARPEDIWYTWAPLRQVTEKERADIFKTTADAARTLAGANAGELIPVDALSDALVNELSEQGVLPGLSQKIEKYGSLAEQSPDLEEAVAAVAAPALTTPSSAAVANDAAPKTLYIRRDVLNAADIIAWAKSQGFKSTLSADDMHVTIAYSRQPVDWMKVGQSWQEKIEVDAGGPRLMEAFGKDGEAKVLLFSSPDLNWRHEAIIAAGASWDHPEYQPHIAISYDPDAPDIATIEPWQGKIILGPERFEDVNEDWQSKIKEAV